MHLLGHGRVWPRRQPRQHLVSLSRRYLYLHRRIGCCHWCIDVPCELISSSSTIFTIGCPLICHYVSKVWYHNSICFAASYHHCVQCYAQLAGRLSTTTSSRRASVHWFLTPLRVVHILTFQRLHALPRMLENFLSHLLVSAAVRSQCLGVPSKSRQDTLRPR